MKNATNGTFSETFSIAGAAMKYWELLTRLISVVDTACTDTRNLLSLFNRSPMRSWVLTCVLIVGVFAKKFLKEPDRDHGTQTNSLMLLLDSMVSAIANSM